MPLQKIEENWRRPPAIGSPPCQPLLPCAPAGAAVVRRAAPRQPSAIEIAHRRGRKKQTPGRRNRGRAQSDRQRAACVGCAQCWRTWRRGWLSFARWGSRLLGFFRFGLGRWSASFLKRSRKVAVACTVLVGQFRQPACLRGRNAASPSPSSSGSAAKRYACAMRALATSCGRDQAAQPAVACRRRWPAAGNRERRTATAAA